LKFDSENHLKVHNIFSVDVIGHNQKNHPGVFKKANLIQTNKTHQNSTLFFSFEKRTVLWS